MTSKITTPPILSVVIPTFNRNEILNQVLGRLVEAGRLDIDEGRVTITVLDNYSRTPVASTLDPEIAGRIQVVRNFANIGMLGNILRCFEHCGGGYLWILGDDDLPSKNCFETILHEISASKDAVYFNFGEPRRVQGAKVKGIMGFLEAIKCFGHQVWLSSGIYRVGAFQPFLRFGYAYGYNQMPHTTVLVLRLQDNPQDECVLLPIPIIESQNLDQTGHWSQINSALAGGTWLDMPISPAVAARLAVLLKGNLQICRYLFLQFLLEAMSTGQTRLYRTYFNQYYHRSFALNCDFRLLFKINFLRLAFLVPDLTYGVILTIGSLIRGRDNVKRLVKRRLQNSRTERL
jgi:glycosyltransferase involved in cell wall biosynthesis